jgi:uncharacterized protein YoxC
MEFTPDQLAQFAGDGKIMYLLLAFAIKYLHSISNRLGDISKSLAVVTEQIGSHERRIQRLEEKTDPLA